MARYSIRRALRSIPGGLGAAPLTLYDALGRGVGWIPGGGRGRRKLGRRRRSIGGSRIMYGASKRRKGRR